MRRYMSTLALMGAFLTMMGAGAPLSDPFAELGVERLNAASPAPELSLLGLDGRTVSLPRDFRGKVVLVSFFTTT